MNQIKILQYQKPVYQNFSSMERFKMEIWGFQDCEVSSRSLLGCGIL